MALGSFVEDVPGYKSRGNFSFEKPDCEEWVGNSRFNSSVYATCDTVDGINPGMTIMEGSVFDFRRLLLGPFLTSGEYRVQDAVLDFSTYNFKTAFTQSFTDGNFTYNPEDVIQASLSGWWNYGYKWVSSKSAHM